MIHQLYISSCDLIHAKPATTRQILKDLYYYYTNRCDLFSLSKVETPLKLYFFEKVDKMQMNKFQKDL